MTIRKYRQEDRSAVRDIAYRTAFMGEPADVFFDDSEVLSDILTAYFTDYEPGSSFVVETGKGIAGYLIGSTDEKAVNRKMATAIIPRAVWKAFRRGTIFRKKNLRFLIKILWGAVQGEFSLPDYSRQYPAILHININAGFRDAGIGSRLITQFKEYLKEKHVPGVHLITMSEKAGCFFVKQGFSLLHKGRRRYFSDRHAVVSAYVYGQTL